MAKRLTASRKPPASVETRVAEMANVASVDLPRAIRLAVRAKSDGLADPFVHQLVAIKLKDAGKFEEAIAELGLGLELDPQNPRLMTEVGFCLLELGRRREAGQVLGVAVKLDPDSARTNFAYGWAAERLGALDVAESGFKRAVALDPNHADALAGLSGLAVRRSEWAAARSYAERAAALDGRQTDALMNLARADIGVGEFQAAATRLEEIVHLPHLKPLARADVHIMTGDALDGAKRYPEAYAAYAKGKAELRDYYQPMFGAPGVKTIVGSVREIQAEFLDTPPSAWAKPARFAADSDERGHAFLLGFPRSGTTLLEQVLATHPDVTALEERPVLIDAEVEFLTQPGGVKRLAGVVSNLLSPYRRSYWKRVREFGIEPKDKVFIDKHPISTLRLPLISKVFPDAKIIFALRDPRDVVLSCFRRNFNMSPATYAFNSIEGAAEFYDAMMTAGSIYLDRLPLDALKLRYEDLVADFDGTARGLCDFLGIDWTEGLKDFARTAATRRIATPSSTQVGRGLYVEGAGQWRNYAFALEPVLPILQPWIEKFGYEPT
jgi:Flp pilus assembly protein TadD